MALNTMLRRATSAVVPVAMRAVRSPRSFHGAVSTIVSVEKGGCLGRELSRGGLASFLRFSTEAAKKPSSDENLIRVLDSEIQCAESEEAPDRDVLQDLPDGFPFEIQDTPGERTVLLKRQYGDESIQVEVDMLTPVMEGEEEEEEDGTDRTRIPMVVNVTKGKTGLCFEFGVSAYPDEIVIDSLSVKNTDVSEDQLAYEGPDFDDLDENLQKAFHKFLEIRGVKPSTTNFLIDYMTNKDSREYLRWLKNVKSFIEK